MRLVGVVRAKGRHVLAFREERVARRDRAKPHPLRVRGSVNVRGEGEDEDGMGAGRW